MQAYTELTPPTAVTHAVSTPFIGAKSLNLIVAKTSLLQIFDVRTLDGPAKQRKDRQQQTTNDYGIPAAQAIFDSPDQRLVLLGEYAIAGTVTSLATAKVPGTRSGGDLLLVACKDAKVSVIEWDPSINAVSTVSIHYFEGDDEQGAPWMPNLSYYSSYLTTDPRNVCAALKYGCRNLAILPFQHDLDDNGPEDPDAMIEDDDDLKLRRKASRPGDATTDKRVLPIKSSYTLLTTMLDPDLIDPIDMGFLHEYREPTLGVLSAAASPSDALLAERRDTLNFTTFTIDVEDRACTQLLSIRGLPVDIFKLVPLALPIGGTLLVGANELIHIDQSGKVYAVAVNDFALQNLNFSMNDQSHLALKLEGSVVQKMSYNLTSLLLVLRSGHLVILSFRMEGRNMAGISVKPVPADRGGSLYGGAASCAVMAGLNTVFVGSLQADATLLECHSSIPEMARKRSHAEMLGMDDTEMPDVDGDDEDEDDLYGGDVSPKKQAIGLTSGIIDETPSDIAFKAQDSLPNYASLSEPVISRRNQGEDLGESDDKLELVLASGCGRSGSLSIMSRSIPATTSRRLDLNNAVTRAWSVDTLSGSPKQGLASLKDSSAHLESHGSLLIVDQRVADGAGASKVYKYTDDFVEEIQGSDFENGVGTIFAGSLAGGTRVLQISMTELRSYDQDLNLSEIVPMADEETGTEFSVRHASFADPYLLIVRDDASAIVLNIDESGDLQEIDKGEQIQDISWTSGCLHRWTSDGSDATLYLLSEKGGLYMYALPNLTTPIYVAEDLRNLPPILTAAPASRRGAMQEALAEILVADLGTIDVHSPFLFIRTENDDVELYEPFLTTSSAQGVALDPKMLRWIRRPCSFAGSLQSAADENVNGMANDSEQLHPCLTALDDVNGYRTVFIPNHAASLVFKEASSLPKVLPLQQTGVHSVASWKRPLSSAGLAVVDRKGIISFQDLPQESRYGDIGWSARRILLGEEVQQVVYHSTADRYVIATNRSVEFILPDDEAAHHAWVKEDISFRPEATHSQVKLLDPESRNVVDSYTLSYPTEQVLCMMAGNLEVSEHTHERRVLIAVGTALTRGEDLPAMGCVYIFDVISVAPDPAKPGTNLALKLLVREEVRGAVTALCEAGAQGLLMMAMGQKLNVRGLTEAGSLLPAAFMDVQEHVTALKNLKGTGMCLVSDAFKGTWFVGFQAEPFKMNLFGKSRTMMPVVAADFLPYDTALMIVIADGEGNLHMYEYNPESPSSLSGQRLLHRAAIHTGHDISSITLLPCAPPKALLPHQVDTNGDAGMNNGGDDDDDPSLTKDPATLHQLLVSHTTGALSLIHPLSEASYRRLTTLQSYLTSSLDAPCALNPRAYRSVDPSLTSYKGAVQEGSSVGAAGGSRTVVDGAMAGRWRELGVRGRNEAWGRVGGFLGGGESEVLAGVKDVEILNGAGLSFF